MTRPCFLVIDPDYPGTISTRKLVIETARFNVLTAYSAQEALATLRRFPALDGVVMDAQVGDTHCADLVREIKQIVPNLPIIITSGRGFVDCGDVSHQLESYDPKKVLDLLRTMFPKETSEILKHDQRQVDLQG